MTFGCCGDETFMKSLLYYLLEPLCIMRNEPGEVIKTHNCNVPSYFMQIEVHMYSSVFDEDFNTQIFTRNNCVSKS